MTVLETAQSFVGTPYVFGGPMGRVPGDVSGCDCSGFLSYVFGQNGISLPAFTDTMFGQTQPDSANPPPLGDLLFYEYSDPSQPGTRFPHVGMALGNGQTIDCKYPGGVSIHPPLNLPYQVRRVPGFNSGAVQAGASSGPPWLLIGVGALAFVLLFGRRNPSH